MREGRARRQAERAAGKETKPKEVAAPPLSGPQPLPPLPKITEPAAPVSAPVTAPAPTLNDDKLKEGLAKVFISGTDGLAKGVNLVLDYFPDSDFEIEFERVSEGEGALWAEFAFPVLKEYLPNMQNRPVQALTFFTIAILSGKIKRKKKENKNNEQANGNTGTPSQETTGNA